MLECRDMEVAILEEIHKLDSSCKHSPSNELSFRCTTYFKRRNYVQRDDLVESWQAIVLVYAQLPIVLSMLFPYFRYEQSELDDISSNRQTSILTLT
jgi:hypothetical protein